jgi:hypothetical protein
MATGTVDLEAFWTLSQDLETVNRAFAEPSTARRRNPRLGDR